MKNSRITAFLIIAMAMIALFTGCKDEEPTDSIVAFRSSEYTLNTDSLYDVEVTIDIEPAATSVSSITVMVTATGGEYGNAFTTDPAVVGDEITLPVASGDKEVSFSVTPIDDGITEDDVELEFEILGLQEGYVTDGISGVFASLIIESKKVPERTIYFEESFGNCASDGNQEFPGNWFEVEALQNSLNTAHWLCSSYPDPCLAINPFDEAGAEGDGAEIWLVSPIIDLSNAIEPILNFRVDRRFDTDIKEYDLKISTDYNGSNFAEATWNVFTEGVSAIEANDPEEDNLDSTGDLDISQYVGETISIAWIYYAEGSKLTATILRVGDLLVAEAE